MHHMKHLETTNPTTVRNRFTLAIRVFFIATLTLSSGSIILAVALMVASPNGDGGSGGPCNVQITSLPYNLNATGKVYCLAKNITVTAAASDFTFTADNITLDGQGYTVSSTGAGTSKITLSGRRHVIIKALTIPNDISITNGDHNQILNTHNSGLTMTTTNDNTISGNTVNIPAGGYAALQLSGIDSKYIEGNTIVGNTFGQSSTGYSDMRFIRIYCARNNLFEANTVTMTGGGNIMQAHYAFFNTFKNNIYTVNYPITTNDGSERYGWYIRDGSSYNTFIGNTVRSNQVAARIGGPGNVTVPWGHDNLLKGNSFYGGLPVLVPGKADVLLPTASVLAHDTTTGNDTFDHNLFYAYQTDTAAVQIGVGDVGAPPTYFTNNTIYARQGTGLRIEGSGKVSSRNNLFYSFDSPAMYLKDNDTSTYQGDNNLYWQVGSTKPITWQRSCCGPQIVSVQTFRTDSANAGKDQNSLGTDPLLDQTNYTSLGSASPAIDAGNHAIPPSPYGGPYIDIGKFEYPKNTAPDVTPPTLTVVYPDLNTRSTPAGRYISSTGLIAGLARDNGDVKQVRVEIDGRWYTALGTNSWGLSLRNVSLTTLATHNLIVQAIDAAGNATTSPAMSFVIDDTPPTGSITTPTTPALSGDGTMSAGASDAIGIASVQFHLDDNPVGFVDYDAPYSGVTNTRIYSNGTHRLSATIMDTAGNFFVTPTVVITITN